MRLEALRQREEDRAKRFMNPRRRSIGVDKDELDMQVEEKRLREIAAGQEKLRDAEHVKALVQGMNEHEERMKEERMRSLQDLRKTLDEQVKQPKNNALAKDDPLDLEACGPASLQRFSGEDNLHNDRKKIQQDQVKYWCAEYALEKKKALEDERRRKQEYAQFVLEQDRIRAQMENGAKRRKEEEARMCQIENLELARQNKLRQEQELFALKNAEDDQSNYLKNCPLLTEEKSLAKHAIAEHRFRPDHFKGFQKEEVEEIYRENDAVIQEKHEIAIREKMTDDEWARNHAELARKMEEAELRNRERALIEKRIQQDVLYQQKEEIQKQREKTKRSGLDEIGTNFFARFGRSCR
mmetsp:Transcript_22303/g.46892  ORF Transcript_22303/g.46892 Transcript_22303/m.46892 type:complete len:354 (-) Transcript_22303:166-1227(-)